MSSLRDDYPDEGARLIEAAFAPEEESQWKSESLLLKPISRRMYRDLLSSMPSGVSSRQIRAARGQDLPDPKRPGGRG